MEDTKAALRRSAGTDAAAIHVALQGAKATLQGTARSATAWLETERITWSARGVIAVDHEIAVIP